MQLSEVLAIFLIFIITFLLTFIIKWRFFKSLPGPLGLPLVGYLPFLGKEPHKKLRDLSIKYGKIFSVNIASANYIIISDYETAKELLNHPLTYSRPNSFLQIVPGNGGFGGMRGEEWKEERKFCVSTMKTLGLGRDVWENMIQEDAEEFVQEIQTWQGKPHCFADPMTTSVSSTNMALLVGRKFGKEESSDEANVLANTMEIIMKYISITHLSASVPASVVKLLYILRIGDYRYVMDTMMAFGNIFRKEIEHRLKSKDFAKQDFISYYLQEHGAVHDGSIPTLSLKNLIGNMAVLFMAGSDTTLSSVHWLLLIVASYPEVRKKIQKEIDDVIGANHQIYWKDRVLLPYTMAAIWEMERWVAINPLYPPREAMESFEFNGQIIPKGSIIVCNSWAIMHDPKYHKAPEDFRPERFLTEDGKSIIQLDSNIPFSIGKRDCPGKNVAMMTIFLYFTALIRKFDITTVDGKMADFEGIFGAVAHPKRQLLRFMERQ